MTQPCIASYGGGVNSTALLVGIARGMKATRPDAVTFADTGAELPETYAFIRLFSDWLVSHGLPAVTWVKNEQQGPLEERCLSQSMLPSLAYGRHKRGCSEKSKQRPQHNWARATPLFRQWWDADKANQVIRLIGYGAEEQHRARIEEDRWYAYEYPLMAWGWDRTACLKAIQEAGLPAPAKSSCFFCPAMKKREILQLRASHPELLDRALELERRARPNLYGKGIKGLGGYFSWQDWLNDLDAQGPPLFGAGEEEEIDTNPFGCVCVTPTPEDDEENDP